MEEAVKRIEGIAEVGANEVKFILFATDLNKRQQTMQSVIRNPDAPVHTE